jgi:MscS family membrane protein
MFLLRENREGIVLYLSQSLTRGIILGVLLFGGSDAHLSAQHPASAAPPSTKTEPAGKTDPLERETPRSALLGFLKYGETGDYATAARYLQLPPGQNTDLLELAKELRALYPSFHGNIALLSDDPKGTVESGLPPGQVRAGTLVVGHTTADIILVRVDDPDSGKIWLISQETLANIPKLYVQLGSETPTALDRIRRATRSGPQLLGMSSTQWLGWLLSIPISWLLAWQLTFLFSAPRRVWCKFRQLPFSTIWDTPVGMPLRCIIAALLHGVFVYLLQPPLLYRTYYFRLIGAFVAGCFGWLASRISDRGFDHLLNQTRTHSRGGESILILMQRLNRVGILIIALVAALALLGLNITATLTGLGIGGLAVALAAQKTLENLIGGVSLLMDKAVQVGDVCKIGERVGTVDDIGLRSLKLRTLEQSLLVVPNGLLAQMQFENMKLRPKLLIKQNFLLRIETHVEQLRFVLDGVQRMLDEDPKIESGTSRLRITNFAGAAFELELFAFGKTGDMREFTGIRQEVILKIAAIVEAAGAKFAAPTRLTYLSTDAAVDSEKTNDFVHRLTDLRATDEAQTGTKST